MKKLFLLVFLLSAFTSSLMCQGWDVSYITNSRGLSNSSVTCINEDSRGRIWFGTWDGLNMYNGRDITVFKPEYDNPESLSSNIIREIADRGDKFLWVATDNGINRLDPDTGKAIRFFTEESTIGEHSFHIAVDSEGRLIANVKNLGIFLYREGAFERVNGNISTEISDMFFDLKDRLWVLSEKHVLSSYDLYFGTDGKCAATVADIEIENVVFAGAASFGITFQTSDRKIHYSLTESPDTICDIDIDSNGFITSISSAGENLIVGNHDGLFMVEPLGKVHSVSENIPILSVCYSSQGIIWAGTDMHGVIKAYSGIHVFDTFSNHFGAYAVRAFYLDSKDRLWVGTKGSGLWQISDGETRRHLTRRDSPLPDDNIYCIVPDGDIAWIGTDGEGLSWMSADGSSFGTIPSPKGIRLRSTYSILPVGNILYIGTGGHGLVKLEIERTGGKITVKKATQFIHDPDEDGSIAGNIIYSIIRESAQNILIGTRDGGLCSLEDGREYFSTIETLPLGSRGSDDIICMLRSGSGSTWVGTSMGLLEMEGSSVKARLTEKDGMPNNTIHAILEDNSGDIWASTNNGLAHIIPQDDGVRIVSFREQDGLQSNEYSDGAAMSREEGSMLYFGGINGFDRFRPDELPSSSFVPPIDFEGFYVRGNIADMEDYMHQSPRGGSMELRLSHANNTFSFKVVPLDYNYSEKCSISYLLEGYNKDWIDLGSSSGIVFSNIPVGSYTLRIRCFNRDGLLSDKEFSMPIRIVSEWYLSVPMILLYTAVFLILIAFIVIYFIKSRRAQRHIDQEESKFVFFTNLTHEFSNSLTLICGPCSNLLQDSSLSPEALQKVKIISSNSDRMRSLMQQIIDFRRAETGHLKLMITPVDIVGLVSTVTGYYTDILERESLSLRIETPENSESLTWNTDINCVEKIIFNLVSNAVKYTPSGGEIIVKIATDGRKLELSVTNTGVGISRENQKTVFDRYEIINRFEKAIAKGRGRSNGIGLSLCKSFSEALGGYMSLESDEVSYARFKVTLPFRPADPNAVAKPSLSQSAFIEELRYDEDAAAVSSAPARPEVTKVEDTKVDVSKPSMLIVDDDQDIRTLVRSVFEKDYRIREAGNGLIALDFVREEAPAIIISDVEMPQMNGIELLTNLKENQGTSHIPVIMLSALTATDDQVKGLKSGADAYVTKPFHSEHLRAVAERIVGRKRELIDYSQSAYAALQQFRGALVKKDDYELVKAATEIVFREMDNVNLSVEDIADGLAVTKMQLYRKFKALIGVAPVEYVRNLRLDHAAHLIKTTNLTVQEVMFQCGFASKSSFINHFRNRFGTTPGKYSTSLRGAQRRGNLEL